MKIIGYGTLTVVGGNSIDFSSTKMKRKKWSELEEQTLLSKYADLLTTGSLTKLKTREKKFRPIADHVNSVHHFHDPISFPFKWSWRDVSIKVQNMRHQYIGVKQKIRVSNDEFNWNDGENHWENFLKYKEVFGDVELEIKSSRKSITDCDDLFGDCGELGFGTDTDEFSVEENLNTDEEDRLGSGSEFLGRSAKKKLRLLASQVMGVKDLALKREEKRRERDFEREKRMKETETSMEENESEKMEIELEERMLNWARKETIRREKMEKEFYEERRKRMRKLEEKREEEDMEWKEKMMCMQIEHEKTMLQMHADSCNNQMQFLRLVCSFFGSANDGGLGGVVLGNLTPHVVLHNLQHSGDHDHGKPGDNSPSEFM